MANVRPVYFNSGNIQRMDDTMIGLLKDGDEIIIDAVKGEINVTLSDQEIEKRKKDWKPRKTNHNSGSIWKYSQTVGPAYEGAVTQPGAKKETHTYADI